MIPGDCHSEAARAVGSLHGGDDRPDVGISRRSQLDERGVPPGRDQGTSATEIGPHIADPGLRAHPRGQAGDLRPEGGAARGSGFELTTMTSVGCRPA